MFPLFCQVVVPSVGNSRLKTSAIFQFIDPEESKVYLFNSKVVSLVNWFESNGVIDQAELLKDTHCRSIDYVNSLMNQQLLQFTAEYFVPLIKQSGVQIKPGYVLMPDLENFDDLGIQPKNGDYTAPFALYGKLGGEPEENYNGVITYTGSYKFV